MTGRLATGLVAVILCVGGVAAIAQPAVSEEVKQRATLLVNEGIKLQAKREFDAAVGKYKEAYCLIPEPALIYNIGTAYQEGSKNAEAASYFRLYLKTAAGGELAPDAKSALKAVSPKEPKNPEVASIACPDKTRPKPRPVCMDGAAPIDGVCPPTCTPPEELRGGACVDPTPISGGPGGPGTTGTLEGTSSGSKKGKTLFYAGLGTAGVGVIALGAGIAFGLRAQNLSDELSAHQMGAWTQELLDKEADGKAAERNQIIFTAVGGAAVAAGSVMIILGLRKHEAAESQSQTAVVPWVTGDEAGFALTGRY